MLTMLKLWLHRWKRAVIYDGRDVFRFMWRDLGFKTGHYGCSGVEVTIGSSQRWHVAFEKSSPDVVMMSFKHLGATWRLLVRLHRDCSKWEEKEEREKEEEWVHFFFFLSEQRMCVLRPHWECRMLKSLLYVRLDWFPGMFVEGLWLPCGNESR